MATIPEITHTYTYESFRESINTFAQLTTREFTPFPKEDEVNITFLDIIAIVNPPEHGHIEEAKYSIELERIARNLNAHIRILNINRATFARIFQEVISSNYDVTAIKLKETIATSAFILQDSDFDTLHTFLLFSVFNMIPQGYALLRLRGVFFSKYVLESYAPYLQYLGLEKDAAVDFSDLEQFLQDFSLIMKRRFNDVIYSDQHAGNYYMLSFNFWQWFVSKYWAKIEKLCSVEFLSELIKCVKPDYLSYTSTEFRLYAISFFTSNIDRWIEAIDHEAFDFRDLEAAKASIISLFELKLQGASADVKGDVIKKACILVRSYFERHTLENKLPNYFIVLFDQAANELLSTTDSPAPQAIGKQLDKIRVLLFYAEAALVLPLQYGRDYLLNEIQIKALEKIIVANLDIQDRDLFFSTLAANIKIFICLGADVFGESLTDIAKYKALPYLLLNACLLQNPENQRAVVTIKAKLTRSFQRGDLYRAFLQNMLHILHLPAELQLHLLQQLADILVGGRDKYPLVKTILTDVSVLVNMPKDMLTLATYQKETLELLQDSLPSPMPSLTEANVARVFKRQDARNAFLAFAFKLAAYDKLAFSPDELEHGEEEKVDAVQALRQKKPYDFYLYLLNKILMGELDSLRYDLSLQPQLRKVYSLAPKLRSFWQMSHEWVLDGSDTLMLEPPLLSNILMSEMTLYQQEEHNKFFANLARGLSDEVKRFPERDIFESRRLLAAIVNLKRQLDIFAELITEFEKKTVLLKVSAQHLKLLVKAVGLSSRAENILLTQITFAHQEGLNAFEAYERLVKLEGTFERTDTVTAQDRVKFKALLLRQRLKVVALEHDTKDILNEFFIKLRARVARDAGINIATILETHVEGLADDRSPYQLLKQLLSLVDLKALQQKLMTFINFGKQHIGEEVNAVDRISMLVMQEPMDNIIRNYIRYFIETKLESRNLAKILNQIKREIIRLSAEKLVTPEFTNKICAEVEDLQLKVAHNRNLERLYGTAQPLPRGKVCLTSNPEVVAMMGVDINSCQNILSGSASYSRGVMGIMSAGHIKILSLLDEKGHIVCRSVVRLVVDETNPTHQAKLLVEAIYPYFKKNLLYPQLLRQYLTQELARHELTDLDVVYFPNSMNPPYTYSGKCVQESAKLTSAGSLQPNAIDALDAGLRCESYILDAPLLLKLSQGRGILRAQRLAEERIPCTASEGGGACLYRGSCESCAGHHKLRSHK